MIFSQKKYLLFSIFIIFIFVLFLLFPEISLATITGSGCETASIVKYQTGCGEEKTVGNCSRKCCDWECCEWDEEDNCTGYCCADRCWDCSCPTQSWDEYKCDSPGCDGNIQIRTCEVSKKGSCPSGCGNDECCVKCGDWETCEACGSWQKPFREPCECSKAGLNKPECKCRGDCIQSPTGLRYYNNPNYPTDPCSPESGMDSVKNIKLPVKLDWDDVEGWKDGWCSGGGHQVVDTCGIAITLSSGSVNPRQQCINNKIEECIAEKTAEAEADPGWDEKSTCEKNCALTWIRSNCNNNRAAFSRICTELCYDYSVTPPYYTLKEGGCTGEPPDPEEIDEECPTTSNCPLLDPDYSPVYNLSEMVQYYEITIIGDLRDESGSGMDVFTVKLDQSEFIPPHPCFFKSNREYKWKVRACCGNGDCGPWSEEKTFTTNLAPEPVWPYDPDWAGPDRAEPAWNTPTPESPYPVHLEWCPVEEAKSYCIRIYKEGIPFCPTLYGPLYCPALVPPSKDFPIQSYVKVGLEVFTKETEYWWKVATCLRPDELGFQCGSVSSPDQICYTLETLNIENPNDEFSQLWKFFGHVTLTAPELVFPEDGGCVNLSHELSWRHVGGARSYRYEIYQINGTPALLINEPVSEKFIPITYLWGKGILALNEKYGWRVQPCWGENGDGCEDGSWSNEGLLWEFTTTGAEPNLLKPGHEEADVLIPIKLNWEDMPCAASYVYEVAEDENFNNLIAQGVLTSLGMPASEISISYNPDTGHSRQLTDYWWRVKTCTDKEGNVCGEWSAKHKLTTFKLGLPGNPHPPNGEKFYTHEYYLGWGSVLGGAFYQYEIDGKIAPTIVGNNNAFIDTSKLELGTYTWRVKACLDANCDEFGPESTWTFTLVEGEAPGAGGLVPCGRYVDNPDTPWNEREACGIEHVFIMIYLILNYLLWKLIPIVLLLLALASGVIFYFSGQLGIPDPISQVKSLWKAAGLGLAVIFLAWTGISLILGLLSYQVGIFGDWWTISF